MLSRDVYLVLRIKSFETPLDPSMIVQRSIQNGFRYYSFLDGNGEDIVVCLHEPSPREPQAQEDLESILAQYSEIQGLQAQVVSAEGHGKPEDLRGHVVLVNEDSGEVVGELDNQFIIQEDPALNEKGREKDAVIIEIPEEGEESTRAAYVRAVPPGEEDIMIKGASYVRYVCCYLMLIYNQLSASNTISGTTNLVLTAITSASSYVIKHSDPHPSVSMSSSGTPPPLPPRALVLLTSERTRKGLSAVHAMSGQAVQISAKTLGLLDSMIKRAIGSGTGKEAGRGRVNMPMSTSMLYPGAPSINRSRSSSPAPPAYGEKPPLPPRRELSPQPPALPPRSGSSTSLKPGPPATFRKRDRLMISVDMILSTIDNSAKQIMDVGSQQLNAVVGHKCASLSFTALTTTR